MRHRRTTNSKENYNSKEENVLNKKKSSITRTIEFVKYTFILIAVLAGIISYLLLTRLGIGKPFQDNYNQINPLLTPDKLEVIAYLPMPPGNLAVSSTNHIYFNFHPEYNPTEIKIAKLINSTYWIAYPSQRFQSKIITCLSMRIDSIQRLWLLDFAQHGTKGTPALYSFDLNTTNNENDEPIISYKFPRNIAGFGFHAK